ncbi:Os03g0797551 [Oryza sativa Japonica Group]|uniref:Os03g0797551 protein n=1 Tax=Oryza sativa subsp. japonica TaxID=39947 RepID=A0A0P0W4S4_ORYSJ|nr:Os03g0797551 [Oryza sativa Japonica Group]
MNAAFPFSLSLDMVRDTDDDIPRSAPAGAGARSSVSDAATAAAGSFRAATRAAPPCNAPVRRVVAGDDGDDAFTVKAMHVAVCGGYVRAVERNRGVACARAVCTTYVRGTPTGSIDRVAVGAVVN